MGMGKIGTVIGKEVIAWTRTSASKSLLATKPVKVNTIGLKLASNLEGDIIQISKINAPFKTKCFTRDEILDMKPDMFSNIVNKRTDIPERFREYIFSPEKLNLYDELLNMDIVKNLPKEKRDKAFSCLFSEYNFRITEPDAQLEILPDLVKKGVDLELLSQLPITNVNKNQVEYILNCEDLLLKSWSKKAQEIIKRGRERNLNENTINIELNLNKKKFKNTQLAEIIRFVDDKNVKYVEDCIELTNNPSLLKYWTKDFSKIIKDFATDVLDIDIADRIFRRSHNYESVKNILGDEKLTNVSARLLEFKNFDKLKDIGLDDLSKLSTNEKKELLNGFISSITPKEILYRKQHNLQDIGLLQSKMKIFREIDTTSDEAFIISHKNIIDKILDSIPISERKIIDSEIDTKAYRRAYRLANPIPALVDDIESVLQIKTAEIKGRKIKLGVMDREPDFAISTHRIPSTDAIKTIEALETTDPNMLICVGTKGGSRTLNFSDSGYAIAVKPRKGTDWHVQAYSDIDSGNNASKNIYNFENVMLNAMGNHCNCIDLVPNKIKQIMNLSQREYTQRMLRLKDCRTLQEIEKLDSEMSKAIRQVIKEENLYEGLIRPEPMAVLVRRNIPKQEISEEILDYCVRRNIPLIGVKPNAKIL